ncbi:YhhA family cyclophane-containing RiPP [Novosphingobium sp. B1]|uniref:YhhA family cyclophane-containing RiPP n=1 Tax=Novosphingobium sp. B1 TaxID=1938756 RepID=UPI0009D81C92|nr:YhhA family cyclophane-containing RiPP [Novosphingobium sp. B1]SMD06233.1 hypothetical protein SAMN06272759_13116 [Novosphingobium sp. B1]
MRIDPVVKSMESAASELDLPIQSVALQRLIAEVRRSDDPHVFDATAYNRTYHRHNR